LVKAFREDAMTLRQIVYTLIILAIIIGVTFFAVSNFQDVDATIPLIGTFHTKLFVVIVLSFAAGYFSSSLIAFLSRLLSRPEKRKTEKEESEVDVENRPVP